MVYGLINGAFYAMLSLGLAIIFGLLNTINVAQGDFYMVGAFGAVLLFDYFGLSYWYALLLAPLGVALLAVVFERTILKRIYKFGDLAGLMVTLGFGLVLEGIVRQKYGSAGLPYATPAQLGGILDLRFMFLPTYRAWVVAVAIVLCIGILIFIERTKLGSYLRAATENNILVLAFGVNVPRMVTLTYGLGAGLAAFAGVMAAPVYQVNSVMGSNIIISVFAVVIIGGLSSILGSIVAGFSVGIIEALTNVLYPQAANTVVFLMMALVLIFRPAGLFGHVIDQIQEEGMSFVGTPAASQHRTGARWFALVVVVLGIVAPLYIYPSFLMKALCFGLFAAAVGLLFSYAGIVSLGHAAFFGGAAYVTAHAAAVWNLPPEICILLGALTGAVLGAIFGWLGLRCRGVYFAMVTLAFAQMIYFIAWEAPFTHREEGIHGVPRGHLFGLIDLQQPLAMYYFVFAIAIAGFLLIRRIVHSPFGRVLSAIRDNEPRTISLGYNTRRHKLLAFVISASLAGVAGGVKAIAFQFATLTDVQWLTSGDVLLMVLVGGVGTIWGPWVGAFVLVALEQYLTQFGSWITTIQGVCFIACILVFRMGIVGEVTRLFNARVLKRIADEPQRPADSESSLEAADVLTSRKP
jgi:branched-chain amino acid transport system permease protein